MSSDGGGVGQRLRRLSCQTQPLVDMTALHSSPGYRLTAAAAAAVAVVLRDFTNGGESARLEIDWLATQFAQQFVPSRSLKTEVVGSKR